MREHGSNGGFGPSTSGVTAKKVVVLDLSAPCPHWRQSVELMQDQVFFQLRCACMRLLERSSRQAVTRAAICDEKSDILFRQNNENLKFDMYGDLTDKTDRFIIVATLWHECAEPKCNALFMKR